MNGFSLLELLIVLAIMSVVTALAAPRVLRDPHASNQVDSISAQIRIHQRAAIKYARTDTVAIGGNTLTFLPTGAVSAEEATLVIDGQELDLVLDAWTGDAALR